MDQPVQVSRHRSRSCWPDRAQLELLKAGLWRGDGVPEAWGRWKQLVSWLDVDTASARVLPLVYRNLRAHRIEDALLARLKGVFLRSLYQQTLLFERVQKLLERLRDEGIDFVLLKGAPLGLVYYGGIGLRPMDDVDVWIRPGELARAYGILSQAGWTAHYRDLRLLVRGFHSCPFYDGSGGNIDLHWRVLEPTCDAHVDDCFWNDAVEFEFLQTRERTLNPTDLLLHSVAHGFPGNEMPTLRWIPDAALILRSAEIDWDRFCREAQKRGVSARCARALSFLASESLSDAPASIITTLERARERWFDRRHLTLSMRDPASLGPLAMLERLALSSLRAARGRGLEAGIVFLSTLRLVSSQSRYGLLRWALSRFIARIPNVFRVPAPLRWSPKTESDT